MAHYFANEFMTQAEAQFILMIERTLSRRELDNEKLEYNDLKDLKILDLGTKACHGTSSYEAYTA